MPGITSDLIETAAVRMPLRLCQAMPPTRRRRKHSTLPPRATRLPIDQFFIIR
jgi:hypothetical protein